MAFQSNVNGTLDDFRVFVESLGSEVQEYISRPEGTTGLLNMGFTFTLPGLPDFAGVAVAQTGAVGNGYFKFYKSWRDIGLMKVTFPYGSLSTVDTMGNELEDREASSAEYDAFLVELEPYLLPFFERFDVTEVWIKKDYWLSRL